MMGLGGYDYAPYMRTGILGFIPMILFWIFIIWLVLFIVRGGMHTTLQTGMGKSSAMRILEERYAKGEIDKKEFEEKIKDLTHKHE